ncbi:MAG: hypothetical protein LC781_21480 [Actinobacteria bacterium]|nr:hypothetical protein [Actinomycetota bacterium]
MRRNEKAIKAVLLAAVSLAMFSITACSGAGNSPSDFSATTLEGEEFGLAQKRGEVVALYFMAAY